MTRRHRRREAPPTWRWTPPVGLARRTVSSLGLVMATLAMATVATTLVATVPTFSDAIADAGVRRVVADAPVDEAGIEIVVRSDTERWRQLVPEVDDRLDERFGDLTTALSFSETASLAVPDDLEPPAGTTYFTTIAAISTGDDALRTVAGDPAARAAGADVAARVHADAADALGLAVGDRIVLDDRRELEVGLRIVALFRPDDPTDPRWIGSSRLRDGVVLDGSFVGIGPFVVAPTAFASLELPATYRWRRAVDPSALDADDVAGLRRSIRGIERTVIAVAGPGGNVDVETELDTLLAAEDRATRSTAGTVAAILIQLVVVALGGLVLAARALSDARTSEAALSRARGASPSQLATAGATEGLAIAAAATVVAPFAATWSVELLEDIGPLGVTGLDLAPSRTPTTWLLAAAVGLVVVAIVTWPAFAGARRLERSSPSRRHASAASFRRGGIDLVVAVIAVIALWQLARAGGASTADAGGRSGADPGLVLAPALGIVAATLLLLRGVSTATTLADRHVPARRGIVGAMAAWEAHRHPSRTSRTATLVILAVSIGAFAATQTATWSTSQRDQADVEVPADLVVTPDSRPAATLSPLAAGTAYRSLEGVSVAGPVDVDPVRLPNARASGELVALDVDALGPELRSRPDVARPEPVSTLDELTDRRRLDGLPLDVVDGRVEMSVIVEASAEARDGGDVRVTAVIVDGDATVHALEPREVPVDGTPVDLGAGVVGLTGFAAGTGANAVDAIELVELRVQLPVPQTTGDPQSPAPPHRYRLRLDTGPPGDAAAPWSIGEITTSAATVRSPSAEVIDRDPLVVDLDAGSAVPVRTTATVRLVTTGWSGAGTVVSDELPALATPAVLTESAVAVGDTLVAAHAGRDVTFRIVGEIGVAPFSDDPRALVVDRPTLVAHRYVDRAEADPPDHWAISSGSDDHQAVAAQLREQPFDSVEVRDRRLVAEQLASDPVSVAVTGSLVLAVGASLIVAVVGLVLTAVVGARERRPSYAVLGALGARRSELRRWLVVESIPTVVAAALAGLAVGIGLARLTMRSLAVGRDGEEPVPPVELVVPWPALGVIVAIAAAAGAALPFTTSRLLGRTRTADELRMGTTA